ncbi:MAG TPA: hypothetical protein VF575_00840 [Candidatus Saccharimonadales bacterium]|jgi:hypothetical protein
MLSITSEQFIALDNAFLHAHADAAKLDPLNASNDNLFEQLQSEDPSSNTSTTAMELFSRSNDWITEHRDADETSLIALRRDLDKATGALVLRKVTKLTEAVTSNYAFDYFIQRGMNPRANFYDYAASMPANLGATYTGEAAEIALLTIFDNTIQLAHNGIHNLLDARNAVSDGNNELANDRLLEVLRSTTEMQSLMADTYRQVGPEFVSNRLTRYLGPITIGDKNYEGPNPSHSGLMTFDRLVVGSLYELMANNLSLASQFAYREQDIPSHHKALLKSLNNSPDANKSIVELTRGTPMHEIAREITVSLRKQKVAHKSYADKGLSAKGKSLTAAEPDMLSDTIKLVRARENT